MAVWEPPINRAQLNLTLLGHKLALEIGRSCNTENDKNLKACALCFQYVVVISKQWSLEAGESVDQCFPVNHFVNCFLQPGREMMGQWNS